MAKTPDEIVAEITHHATVPYSGWYAGIAKKAKKRMFNDHNVDEQSGSWISCTAESNADARSAEDALHAAGFQGGPRGGTFRTKKVYAYKITSSTIE